jgi:hypothetical protein
MEMPLPASMDFAPVLGAVPTADAAEALTVTPLLAPLEHPTSAAHIAAETMNELRMVFLLGNRSHPGRGSRR